MEVIIFLLNAVITVTSLIVLYFAFAKNNNLARLSVFTIFGSLLIQQFIGIMGTLDLFNFMSTILGSIRSFVVYGEIVLLIVLLISKWGQASNKTFRYSMIILIITKVFLIIGIL